MKSLGPSNDDPPVVRLEMRAARSLGNLARDWIADVWDMGAGTLAFGESEHLPEAWAWDISCPLAEQGGYATAADDREADALVDEGSDLVTGLSEPGTTDRAHTEEEIDAMADDGRLTGIAMRMAIAAGVDWPSLNPEEQDGWHEQAITRLRGGAA